MGRAPNARVAGLLAAAAMLAMSLEIQAQAGGNGPFVAGRLLVRFHDSVPGGVADQIVAAHGGVTQEVLARIGTRVIKLPPGAPEAVLLNVFRSLPVVEYAELDAIYSPVATPNDPSYSTEWHLSKIAAPMAWNTSTGSSSIIIAILDTGVDGAHPDLVSKLVPGWNMYDNNADTADVFGHGTAVAGTAAAASNNALGVASIAWGCPIMPIRISALDGMASTSTIANGLVWAADHGARVANISYKVTKSASVTSAAQYLESKGGVVAVSAGNDATFDATADNPSILTVSATDSGDHLASFSNTGNNVDLAAPGVSIKTTNKGGGYGSWSGTSFSAPVVAGVAALVMSANPSLSAADVRSILRNSADDLGASGFDASFGTGRVNAAKAVSLAVGGQGPVDAAPTVAITSPAAGASVSGSVTVTASASDDVAVASVSLRLDGVLVGTDTTAPYTFAWSTLSASNGAHVLLATALDSVGHAAEASIQVTVANLADTTPPSIVIKSPVAGAKVKGNVGVTVTAADDVAVKKVELYVDGKLIGTSTSAPFTIQWNTKKSSAGSHTLQSKAYDAAGNAGASPTVGVVK